MPLAPLHPCAAPGCGVRLPRGTARCPTHTQQQERQRRMDTPGRLVYGAHGTLIDYYQSPAWKALRAEVLREEPLCVACLAAHHYTPSTHVDHRIPRTAGGSDERANLQALCAQHHSEKTQRERRGFGGG